MSQGRATIDDRAGAYEGSRPGRMLRQLLRSGQPFSGGERHCCFLNTNGGRFADVSAISGLNIPDDGRGVGVVDWDQDGRLDLWVTNRSGPQVRFMRNTAPVGDNRFLAIKLQGVESNRDAIGARVALKLVGSESLQLRTVRAGSGYLSQSSRWLHFGVGAEEEIQHVSIRWPSGVEDQLSDLQVNRRYVVTEGGGAKTLDGRRDLAFDSAQSSGQATEPAGTQIARLVLTTPLPIPKLSYESTTGAMVDVESEGVGRPRLLNLWSRSCDACLDELNAFTNNQSRLDAAGIEVIALNVDSLAIHGAAASEGGAIPFPEFRGVVGRATERVVDALQLLHDVLLDLHETIPVPTSFLLDGDGRLAAIYKGPVEIEQLLADVEILDAAPTQRRISALPFSGQWSAKVREPRILRVALEMLLRGWLEEAEAYRHAHQDQLAKDSDYPLLLYNLGQRYSGRQEHERAQALYEDAIRRRPEFGPAHFNLGVTLARGGRFEDAMPYFSAAVKADPQDVESRLNLGRTLLRLGKLSDARDALRDAVKIAPQNVSVCFELAVTYALSGDVEQANSFYQRAVAGDAKYKSASYWKKMASAARTSAKMLESRGDAGRRAAEAVRKRIMELERNRLGGNP